MKEGQAKVEQGTHAWNEACMRHKKINALESKLEQTTGDTINVKVKGKDVRLSKDQAKNLLQKQHTLIAKDLNTAIVKSTAGKVQAVAGHSLKSGSKELTKSLKDAPKNAANALGGLVGDALFNYDRHEGFTQAAKGVGKGAFTSTVVEGTKNVAFKAIKGGIKELAPELGKKIPGINTLNNVYNVGSSMLNANSTGEALTNGLDSSLNLGISYGSSALVQGFVPVPFVGALIGGFIGSAAIYYKDRFLYR